MIYLRMWRTEVPAESPPAINDVIEEIPDVRPLFQSAIRLQADLLRLPPEAIVPKTQVLGEDLYLARRSAREVLAGEVLTDGTNLYVLTYSPQQHHVRVRRAPEGHLERVLDPDVLNRMIVQLTYIGPEADEAFERPALEALQRKLEASFERHYYRSSKYAELRREGEVGPPPEPTEEERTAARLLADTAVRRLAIAIKSSGGLLLPDLEKQLEEPEKPRASEIRTALETTGLIETDVVVICRRNQSQVNRVASREALASLSKQGLRCACGREIDQERAEEAVAITPLGQEMINGSRWMVVLLIDELLRLGLPLDNILVEQQIGGDEMDCFADLSGELIFFELKDKVFSLGNAYSFGAKLGIIQPEFSLIVTTDRVGNDAKEHFDRAAAAGQQRGVVRSERSDLARGIRYVEGLSSLRASLEQLAHEVYLHDAEGIVASAFEASSIGTKELLSALAEREAGDGRTVAAPSPRTTRKKRS
jgi:hypothetical protein